MIVRSSTRIFEIKILCSFLPEDLKKKKTLLIGHKSDIACVILRV